MSLRWKLGNGISSNCMSSVFAEWEGENNSEFIEKSTWLLLLLFFSNHLCKPWFAVFIFIEKLSSPQEEERSSNRYNESITVTRPFLTTHRVQLTKQREADKVSSRVDEQIFREIWERESKFWWTEKERVRDTIHFYQYEEVVMYKEDWTDSVARKLTRTRTHTLTHKGTQHCLSTNYLK